MSAFGSMFETITEDEVKTAMRIVMESHVAHQKGAMSPPAAQALGAFLKQSFKPTDLAGVIVGAVALGNVIGYQRAVADSKKVILPGDGT